ncbi:MAG TPA: hypothetical protein VF731_00980 [Solirubrobacterales bacterium]
MGRRRQGHHEQPRAAGRARSARVLAVDRREVDLDRFVAALLALAARPGEASGQRQRRTGEASFIEQPCRR